MKNGFTRLSHCTLAAAMLLICLLFLHPLKADAAKPEIGPDTITAIEIMDISWIEGTNGYYHDYQTNHYIYDCEYQMSGYATFADGTIINFIYSYLEWDHKMYDIDIDMPDQEATPWVAGHTYTATGTLWGVSDTFTITILPSPVETLVFEDVVLYQGLDYLKFCSPGIKSLVVKDNAPVEIYSDYVIYNGCLSYVDSDAETLWEVGNTYQATGYLLGASATFNVTVLPCPIETIELITPPDKTEYFENESVNLKGAVLRVQYTDGSHEDIAFEADYTESYRSCFTFEAIDRYVYFATYDSTLEIRFEEIYYSISLPVTFKPWSYERITLRENADKSLTITAHAADHTSIDMNILDFGYMWLCDDNEYYGGMFTDQGDFSTIIHTAKDAFFIELYIDDEHTLQTNTIPGSQWFQVREYLNSNYISHLDQYKDFPVCYSGITKDNIDAIIELAGYIGPDPCLWYSDLSYHQNGYQVFQGEDIRKTVLQKFALDQIDLTLSSNYDAKTDTYRRLVGGFGIGEIAPPWPNVIRYDNGEWLVTCAIGDYGKKANLRLNENLQIISFNTRESGLEHEYVTTVTKPTCTQPGYTSHTCVCGDCYTDAQVDALGHTIVDGLCTTCNTKPVRLTVAGITLRSSCAGLYFEGSFDIDKDVIVARRGLTVSAYKSLPTADGSDPYSFWAIGSTSVLVSHILSKQPGELTNAIRGKLPVYARAYVQLKDGTYIYSDVVSFTLQQIVEAADSRWNSLDYEQQTAISDMYQTFKSTMSLWNIPNLKAS